MSIREKIAQLEMEREELKVDLFDARAEQAEQIRLWTVEGISTPLEQRLELQAEIKHLEAERQASKVALMKLKRQLREINELTYAQVVWKVLEDNRSSIPDVDAIKEATAREYAEQVKDV